jgi:hypothetical protein
VAPGRSSKMGISQALSAHLPEKENPALVVLRRRQASARIRRETS